MTRSIALAALLSTAALAAQAAPVSTGTCIREVACVLPLESMDVTVLARRGADDPPGDDSHRGRGGGGGADDPAGHQ